MSDVAHPDSNEIREFSHATTLAELFTHDGELEWVSEPQFVISEGDDMNNLGNASRCLRIRSAWDKVLFVYVDIYVCLYVSVCMYVCMCVVLKMLRNVCEYGLRGIRYFLCMLIFMCVYMCLYVCMYVCV